MSEFGEMSRVLSASRPAIEERHVLNVGINGNQLFCRDGRWWISAWLWRREGREIHIPDTPCSLAPPGGAGP